MTPDAFTQDDQPVYAGQYTPAEWDTLKALSLEKRRSLLFVCYQI